VNDTRNHYRYKNRPLLGMATLTGAVKHKPVWDEAHSLRAMTYANERDATRFKKRQWFQYYLTDKTLTNQGALPIDTACAWYHWLRANPDPLTRVLQPQKLIQEAYPLDGMPLPDAADYQFRGTTIDAVGEALKRRGFIADLFYSNDHDEILEHLMYTGPVVFACDWHQASAMVSGKQLLLRGPVVSFHAILIIGFNLKHKRYRIVNSQGAIYGERGRKDLYFDDMKQLLRDGAYAMTGSDKKQGAVARGRAAAGVWKSLVRAPEVMPGIENVEIPEFLRQQYAMPEPSAATSLTTVTVEDK
jgi:hypothetical protein